MTQLEFARLEQRAEQIVRKLGLPPCPEILVQIAAEVRSRAPNVRRIGDLVVRDVAASAGILKIVNSAAYGLGGSCRSVHQAVSYLGLDRTALLLAGLLLRKAFASSERPAMTELWRRSAHLALAAGFLARATGGADREEAYTFGLFREVGTAVLILRCADYEAVMGGWQESTATAVTEHEKQHFGTDHAVIGAVLAREWHLPEAMSDAILWHHAEFVLALEAPPVRVEAVRLIALGVLAERVLARYEGAPPDPRGGPAEHALRRFGLNERDFADLQDEALTLLAEHDGRPMPTLRIRSARA